MHHRSIVESVDETKRTANTSKRHDVRTDIEKFATDTGDGMTTAAEARPSKFQIDKLKTI